MAAVSFFSTMFDLEGRYASNIRPRWCSRFTDVSVVSKEMMNAVSLINLGIRKGVRAKGRAQGGSHEIQREHLLRGMETLQRAGPVESGILDRRVRLKVVMRTRRCAATEVDPDTARRDRRFPD